MATPSSRRTARGSGPMSEMLTSAIHDEGGTRATARTPSDGLGRIGEADAIANGGSLNARGSARVGRQGADGREIPNGSLAMGVLSADDGARGAKRSRDGAIGGRSSASRGAASRGGGKAHASMDGFPGTVSKVDGVVRGHARGAHAGENLSDHFDEEGWNALCARRFADKKTARLAVLEWYSTSSASSARLICDKWRESKVRYVLRCQTAMPKRSEKSNKDVCIKKGSMCAMCVQMKFNRDSGDWAIVRDESVPTHDAAFCADSRRPNATSVHFAAHLKGLDKVAPEDRQGFIATALEKSGYRITSGTKQRAVALALGKKARRVGAGSLGQ